MVKLGNYKGLKVSKNPVAVSAEEIDNAINMMRQQNTRSVKVDKETVEQGDTALIDYEGFVDGVAFDGGKDQGYALEIGSGTFIPGFEEGLVGAKVGQEVDVTVTFPTEYHAEALAGKEAVFKCMVHEIQTKEVPELDDAFVKQVSEFETVADFKADVEKNLLARKERESVSAMQDSIIEMLIEGSEVEITEADLNACVNEMMAELAQSLQRQGMSVEMYMQFTGLTETEIAENLKPQAEKRAQMEAVLKAIAEAENITVSEEEYENQIAQIAAQYNASLDQIREAIGANKDAMKKDMMSGKAFDLVMKNAVIA